MSKSILAGVGTFIGFTLLLSAVAAAGIRALSGGTGMPGAWFIGSVMAVGVLIGLPSAIALKYYRAKQKEEYNDLETLAAADKNLTHINNIGDKNENNQPTAHP